VIIIRCIPIEHKKCSQFEHFDVCKNLNAGISKLNTNGHWSWLLNTPMCSLSVAICVHLSVQNMNTSI